MNIFTIRNTLLFFIVLATVLLTVTLIRSQFFQTFWQASKAAESTHLPADVERIVKDYKYQENSDDLQVEVSGAKIIHRGRSLLGLRSNLVKATFFEDVRGRLKTAQVILVFSAATAEWSTDVSQPFILKKLVTISINGKELNNVKRARIYFKQGVLEVNGFKKEIFRLTQ